MEVTLIIKIVTSDPESVSCYYLILLVLYFPDKTYTFLGRGSIVIRTLDSQLKVSDF